MQKTQFVEQVATEAGVTRSQADKVVRATLKVIEDALRSGEKVTLTGFGSFEVRQRGERQVTSIRSKEKVTVAASKLPSFSAGSELKAAVNGRKPAKEGAANAEVVVSQQKAAAPEVVVSQQKAAAPVEVPEIKEVAETKEAHKSKKASKAEETPKSKKASHGKGKSGK